MSSERGKMNFEEIIKQVADGLRSLSAFSSFEIVDATESTVKIRIYARKDLYVQLYANYAKDKLNLTLIHGDERIYGEDSEGGVFHIHSFDDPMSHIVSKEDVSLETFLAKVQEYIERSGLI